MFKHRSTIHAMILSTEDMTDEISEDTILNLEHIDYVVNKKKIVTTMNEHDSI